MGAVIFYSPRFRLSGDCALLVEYGEGIDPAVNERVRTAASIIKARSIAGIRAVIPAYRSLAILYDPLLTDPREIEDTVKGISPESCGLSAEEPALVKIPVCYGGEFGPDMPVVSAHTGLTEEQIIELHASTEYPIYMMGFTPGFCYLGGMDERLRTPRRATPRPSVPEGSVGIAESQTGMYPVESPGGWQIIGRTPLRLFAPERATPFLYKAGDRIRFYPIEPEEFLKIAEKERGIGGL